ncbi:MAG: ABC transporter transmembrane domain-containing protein, partial [Chloroflexia bacterium]
MNPHHYRPTGPQTGAELGVPPGAGGGQSQRFWSVSSIRNFMRAARATMVGLPRVMRLVWESHRGLTVALGVVTLVQAFIPALQVYLSKLLIDAVVEAVRAGGAGPFIRTVVVLSALQFAAGAAASLLQTVGNISQQLLQERTSIRVQTMIIERSNSLDLANFENPQFYDSLQQAQQQSAFRPVQMVAGAFSLVRTVITFLSMIALLFGLGWIVATIALLSPIPSFIATSRYGWWGFQLMRRQSPARRLMNYLTSVLTTDTFAKEVKIFGVGPFFLSRYTELAENYYQENRSLLIRRYLMSFAWGSLTILATSATYLYVALLAVAGRVTLGDLTLFVQAATSVQ